MRFEKYFSAILVGALLILFVGLSCYRLGDLAPREEEAICGLGAASVFNGQWLSTGDAFMQSKYVGRTKELFAVPFLFLLGQTVFAVRFAWVFCALVSLVFMYMVIKSCFGQKTAVITILLLSCNSSFIRAVRIGCYREEIFQIMFLWVSLWLFGRALDNKRKWNQYLAFFLVGVAFWAKVMFMGYMLGGAVAVVLCGSKTRRNVMMGLFHTKMQWIKSAGAFMLGALPFIIATCGRVSDTLSMVLGTIQQTNVEGASNMALLHNVVTRFLNFWSMLKGTMDHEFLPVDRLDHFYWLMFTLSFGAVLLYLFFPGEKVFAKDRLRFMLTGYAVVFLLTSFIPGFLTPEHLIILVPFVELICALGAVLVLEKARKFKCVVRILLCLFGLLYAGSQLRIMAQVYDATEKKLGMNDFSAVMFDFTHYLEDVNIDWVVSLSHFMGPNIEYISKGKVKVYNQRAFKFNTDPDRMSEYPEQVRVFYNAYIKGRPGVHTVRRYDTANQDGFMNQLEKLGEQDGIEWVFVRRFKSATGRDDIGLLITRYIENSSTQ